MSKIKKVTIDVKGMSIEDIMNISRGELLSMSEADITALNSRLASAVNKRIKRAKPSESGVYSPAISYLARMQGKHLERGELPHVSAKIPKGLTKKEARNLALSKFSQFKGTLEAKTSTNRGFKKAREEAEKRIGKEAISSYESESAFWDGYNEFMEKHKAEVYNKGSDVIIEWLKASTEYRPTDSKDAIRKRLEREYNTRRKSNEDKFTTFRGVTLGGEE